MPNLVPKYHEKELTDVEGAPLCIKHLFEGQLTESSRYRSETQNRSRRKPSQFVALGIDDSASMGRFGKCEAASEGAREMLYDMRLRSKHYSLFDVAIFKFGDYVFANEKTLGVPVLDINADDICFKGTSGGTRIKLAMSFFEDLLKQYENAFLQHQESAEAFPPPLVVLMSDGHDGDRNPVPVADRIKRMRLSNGLPPIVVTVGIEYGGDEPDVALLQKIATVDQESGRPLYFDISNLDLLINFLASAFSSGSSTPAQFLQAAIAVNPDWR